MGIVNYVLQVLKVINVDPCGGEIKMTREEAFIILRKAVGDDKPYTVKAWVEALEALRLIKFEEKDTNCFVIKSVTGKEFLVYADEITRVIKKSKLCP